MSYLVDWICTYLSVDIIGLSGLPQVPGEVPAVDHSTMHGYGLAHYLMYNILAAGKVHGMDASFRERQVDRFGKVQRDSGRITEIYINPDQFFYPSENQSFGEDLPARSS